MNQDFTVPKKKDSRTSSERKEKSMQAGENSPPPITFLLVRP